MQEYLKMSGVFKGELFIDCDCDDVIVDDLSLTVLESFGAADVAKYAAHAINSHDELVQMNKELLEALNGCAKELAWIIDQHNEQNMEDGSWKYDYQTPGEAMQLVFKAKGGAA